MHHTKDGLVVVLYNATSRVAMLHEVSLLRPFWPASLPVQLVTTFTTLVSSAHSRSLAWSVVEEWRILELWQLGLASKLLWNRPVFLWVGSRLSLLHCEITHLVRDGCNSYGLLAVFTASSFSEPRLDTTTTSTPALDRVGLTITMTI